VRVVRSYRDRKESQNYLTTRFMSLRRSRNALSLGATPSGVVGHIIRAAHYGPQSMLIYAAFWWWFVGSLLAFLLVIAFGMADRAARAAGWIYRS
jgi:hypothetical protein